MVSERSNDDPTHDWGYYDRDRDGSGYGSINPITYKDSEIRGIWRSYSSLTRKSRYRLLFYGDPGYIYVYLDNQLYYEGNVPETSEGFYQTNDCKSVLEADKTYTVKISDSPLN